jgi:membrane protein
MAESMLTTEQQVKSMWRLGGLSIKELARRVGKEIQHDNVLDLASALAYNFLFALFPLLLFLVALMGYFASSGSQLTNLLYSLLGQVLPAGVGDLISKTMSGIVNGSGGGKMTIGIVLGLYSASSGTAAKISGLNAAYELHDRRSWLHVRAIALGLTLGMAALSLAALAIVLFGGNLANHFANTGAIGPVAKIAWKIIQWPIALFFVSFAFALVYYYGPDVEEQHWYWITPGSLIGVGLWLIVSFILRTYLHFYNSYNRTYGSLGAVIILLLWLWISGLAFLAGGEINSEIEHAAAHRGHPEAKAEGERQAA